MPVRVVDASALGALLFAEPKAEEVSRALAGADAVLVAPILLWFEVASVCLKKITAHPDRTDAILTAFGWIDRMAIEAVAVDHAGVVRLALEEGLTTYDASYLWLTRLLNGTLITLDRTLGRVAHRRRRR